MTILAQCDKQFLLGPTSKSVESLLTGIVLVLVGGCFDQFVCFPVFLDASTSET